MLVPAYLARTDGLGSHLVPVTSFRGGISWRVELTKNGYIRDKGGPRRRVLRGMGCGGLARFLAAAVGGPPWAAAELLGWFLEATLRARSFTMGT